MNEIRNPAVQPLAQGLSYAGLLPFVGLAALLWVPGTQWMLFAAKALLTYGAVIASFLGAIHWSIAQRSTAGSGASLYLWGVTPSLIAWCVVLVPVAAIGLAMMGVLLACCYGVDRRVYPRHGLAHWLPLRLQLTAVAAVSCFVGAVAIG